MTERIDSVEFGTNTRILPAVDAWPCPTCGPVVAVFRTLPAIRRYYENTQHYPPAKGARIHITEKLYRELMLRTGSTLAESVMGLPLCNVTMLTNE